MKIICHEDTSVTLFPHTSAEELAVAHLVRLFVVGGLLQITPVSGEAFKALAMASQDVELSAVLRRLLDSVEWR